MKIAFVVYDGVTTLDFAGAYDPITRLKSMGFVPDLAYDVCARAEIVRSFEGVRIVPDRVNPDLFAYDYVIIPGGDGVKELMRDREFREWIAGRSGSVITAAVCGGALLIGAAGMLSEKRATTHPDFQPVLNHFAREISTDRIVEDGNVITAGGVTSAIDMGLYICEKIAGADVRKKIQKQMDYRHYTVK